MRRSVLFLSALAPLATGFVAAGCGAAYYGTALGIIASGKDTQTIDTSFPDAVPTDMSPPPFGTLELGDQVTVQRTSAAGATVDVTGLEVRSLQLPAGYGETLSNRDAGQTLGAGDRLVVQIDGDAPQELLFDATDVSSVGTGVAAAIQRRVRLLTPNGGSAAPESYTRFTASFDPTTLSYRLRSGAPGPASSVVFEPVVGGASVQPDPRSTATAMRLGLGIDNGAIRTRGDDGLQVTILNRGTDTITDGTPVEMWLSHDKVLDEAQDLQLGTFPTDAPIAVGEARRFSARARTGPPRTLVRQDFTPGRWFLLLRVLPSGGEQVTTNNVLVSPAPLEVYDPLDDPATPTVETALPLDFAFVRTISPLAVVSSRSFVSRVSIANYGAPVPPGGRQLDLEVVLSGDQQLDEPAAFRDLTGARAGVIVNPTDPARPITVRLMGGGSGGIAVGLAADVLTVQFDGAATVAALVSAIDGAQGGLVDAQVDGNGNPFTDTVTQMVTASGKTDAVARDLLLGVQRVTFPETDRPIVPQPFAVGFTVSSAFRNGVLPVRLFPFYRLRLVPLPGETLSENGRNDVRQGANFVRVYDQNLATFDPITGTTLPTVNADDFARLDAVTNRPVNTGSIRQGQQRVFSFQIPATGLALDESQLLVILRTSNFDAHLDLLSSTGELLVGSDDSPLGLSPLVYAPVQGSGQNNRTFYLVVGTALADDSDLSGGGEAFELTISVNSRAPGDLGPVSAVEGGNVLSRVPQRYPDLMAPRTVNDVLMPFSLTTAQAEVMFVLPERARVRFRTTPVFTIGTTTTITRFVEGAVPTPVEHQAVLEEASARIIYRPSGGGTENAHLLERGVYTFAVEGLNQIPDTQRLRLEVDTEFVPPDSP